jgi:hypothetical protein
LQFGSTEEGKISLQSLTDLESSEDELDRTAEPQVDSAAAAENLFQHLIQHCAALEKKLATNSRKRYNKFNSTNRTTLISRSNKIQRETDWLRTNGYRDIQSFWPMRKQNSGAPDLVEVHDNAIKETVTLTVEDSTDEDLTVSRDDPMVQNEDIMMPFDFSDDSRIFEPFNIPPNNQSNKYLHPPRRNAPEVLIAIISLRSLLKDKRKFHHVLWARIASILSMLHFYTGSAGKALSWTEASDLAAQGAGKKDWYSRQLRNWARSFITTQQLPTLNNTNFKHSMIEDESLAQEIKLYLQTLGKHFKAADVVFYLDQPEIKERFGISKAISERTAQRFLNVMSYRYGKEAKGMYSDGHERDDVVQYRNDVFLPLWKELERRMLLRDRDGNITQYPNLLPNESQLILITHDESTFFATDQRKTRWIHSSETPKPIPKGDGASLMISHFCSPEFGWLESEDG